MNEKRFAPRYPVHWGVRLEHGTGTTRDISTAGLFVEFAPDVADPGSLLRFALYPPREEALGAHFECAGQVRRWARSPSSLGVGVSLSQIALCTKHVPCLMCGT